MNRNQAAAYVRENHRIIPNGKKESLVSNCFRIGEATYQRRDGEVFTEEDIGAFKSLDLGQVTRIKSGGLGDKLLTIYWECDSSG